MMTDIRWWYNKLSINFNMASRVFQYQLSTKFIISNRWIVIICIDDELSYLMFINNFCGFFFSYLYNYKLE